MSKSVKATSVRASKKQGLKQTIPSQILASRERWLQSRVQMFRQLRSNVEALLGKETLGLQNYRKSYEREVASKKWSPSSRNELLSKLAEVRFVLLADFHALQQSQRAQLRLIKGLPAARKKVLAVECIQARYQKKLDAYLSGKMSEQDFLKQVDWHRSWGFPWESYRPLFEWARLQGCPMIALNQDDRKRTAVTLHRRDKFAAETLAAASEKYPNHQMIVCYGDLHMADRHLPAEIRRAHKGLQPDQLAVVMQNSESIYFHLLHQDREMQVDVVCLRPNRYCLLSVPPWVKWQSYLLFLESQFDAALDEEQGLDYTDHVHQFCKVLCSDLHLPMVQDNFSVYSASDDIVFSKLQEHFQGAELRWFKYLMEASKSFYIPELELAYMGKATVNDAASLAMAIIHAQQSGLKRTLQQMPQDFRRLIFSEAIQYFGAKMINPKRKTDTVSDIRAGLASRGSLKEGREALVLALAQKMKELVGLNMSRGVTTTLPTPKAKISYYEAARLLGGMMGERLYTGFREKLISTATIVKLIRSPLEADSFSVLYAEILEVVEALPEPFQSKTEKV